MSETRRQYEMDKQETIADILRWVDESPTTARYLSAASKLGKMDATGLSPVNIAILRNITIETILPYITVKCFRYGLCPKITIGAFDNVHQEALTDQSALYVSKPDIIVLALRLHALEPDLIYRYTQLSQDEIGRITTSILQQILGLVKAIRARSSAVVLVHGFETVAAPAYGFLDAQLPYGQQRTIRQLNASLAESLSNISGAYLVDIDHILACTGYENGTDERYWHIGRAPYKSVVLEKMALEYAVVAAALKGKNKKCLALDCDNTLWGGVIGEDGIDGIKLGSTHPGSAYWEFQAAILDLYHRGILLTLNSKNNENDVLQVLNEHPGGLLKRDHFATVRINWQDKAANLREIAAELNIGLDSIVFVDDNPAECEFVRESLPEVTVLQLPSDPTAYRHILQNCRLFDTLSINEDDRNRNTMYRQQAERQELEKNSDSLEDYLRSLNMILTMGLADTATIPRIAQLTQKTNQYNLTTRRYNDDEIRTLAQDRYSDVYWVRLQDRFGDNGIIGAAIVRYDGDDTIIDTFLLSCRVIGRGVEDGMLARIANDGLLAGRSRILGEFIPTPKNAPASTFFERRGFQPPDDPEKRWWKLSLNTELPVVPDWLKIVD